MVFATCKQVNFMTSATLRATLSIQFLYWIFIQPI
ncbi:hypothetical protein CN315_16320 [Bacillus cereus]|uniref:Uncharacterized protein n=1 Tax=Bacillus cereus (strain Q1) TaxID=361100 RepID=B9IYS5_BACCQ|nr:conserved hypothetical protein [Bacillus cereus Q1]ASZ18108.1 hypothetical protein CK938_16675 [Bacillus cereus]MBR9737334.1 hypothetical protein [Bacillus paranthracis]OUA68547.1 hypothetical protein BK786_05095 [Bacillus thuringiensis serovar thailandensis]OUB95550.1 hypothetical protein BK752_20865 [Bacillus thuringiensis serovar canadensis]OWW11425.1 hypothetical protein BUE63_03230 [Bacillus sp. MB353a]OXM01004.1 hypothetical protein B6N65_04705 [Bacillus sp. KbaB1]PDY87129.1 hypothe